MAEKVEGQEAEEVPAAGDPAALQAELEASRKQAEELLSRVQYFRAELENTRKRTERDMDQIVRYANETLVSRLLPILDDLDAAIASIPGEAGRGYALVRENLWKVLEEVGLEEIPTAGETFDPYLHECIQLVEDEGLPDGHVREVVQRGYTFRKRVLRPARVAVVKHKTTGPEGDQDG